MRMKILVMSVLMSMVLVAADEMDDAQLSRILDRAVRYEDNPDASWAEVRYAIRCAGGNSNRVVSLMKQRIVGSAEESGTTMFYLSEIGKYGTQSDLDFLCQRVSSTNLCEVAADAMLKLAGASTGTVSRICDRLPADNSTNSCVVSAWITMIAAVREDGEDQIVRNMMISNAVEYASRQNVYADRIDQSIMRLDPSYRMSRRRLNAMRRITVLGVHPSRTNYVAKALHELESYPEANLPE